jgi:hypothetical protein
MVFEFDKALESRMLANDPSVTGVSFQTCTTPFMDNYAERAARALAASTHIVELNLSFCSFHHCSRDRGDVLDDITVAAAPFVEWIQSSQSLEEVRLSHDASQRQYYDHLLPPHLLPLFLQAVNSRAAKGRRPLKSVSLAKMTIKAVDVVKLLQHSMIQELCLEKCKYQRVRYPSHDIRQLAQAFGANCTVSKLTLGLDSSDNEAYFCEILNALQSNVTVERLTIQRWTRFFETIPSLVINAISNLLRSSMIPITNLSLDGFNWKDNLLDPVATSIQNSPTIQSLEFSGCYFPPSACNQLHWILSHASTTRCLTLSGCVVFLTANGNRMLTDIIETSHALHQLSLVHFRANRDEFERFQAILDGLASVSCSVQRLELDSLHDAIRRPFFHAIASFHKVQYVSFDISSDFDALKRKDLLMAFRRNGTLLDANVTGGGLNAADLAQLHAYPQRNLHLQALIHSKADSLKSADSRDLGCLLPSLLHVSMNGAPCTARRYLFDALLRCGDSIGPSWRRGKRSSATQ